MKKPDSYYGHNRPEMLKFIPKNAKKILEIGCGKGGFSCQLKSIDNEIWAVEANKNSANEAATKLDRVICSTIDKAIADLPDNYFDLLICNDILEHLTEPWDDLALLKQKLRPDAIVVSSIPNVRYLKNLTKLLLAKSWKYTDQGTLDITHYRFFTKSTIKNMYERAGFSVQQSKGINATKSLLYLPLGILINILTLFTQTDILFMQFATIAKPVTD